MFLWNLIWLNVLKRLIRAACRLAFHKTASSGFSMSKKPGAPSQYSDALCLTSKLHRCGTSPATRFGRCRQSAWALLLRTCTPGVCCARNSVRPGPKRQRCRPPCNTKKRGGRNAVWQVWQVIDAPPDPLSLKNSMFVQSSFHPLDSRNKINGAVCKKLWKTGGFPKQGNK